MDFDRNYLELHGHGRYETIDPALLPRLYLAYKTDLSKVSGAVFNNLKERFDKGDETVLATLAELADLAERGKNAILERNYDLLNEFIDLNFDLRCKIMNISDSNMELVAAARNAGASAKFTGSGGAIVGAYRNDDVLRKLIVNLKKINARVVKPYIV